MQNRLICKILGLFVDPLTADEKYSPLNKGNSLQHFQMELSQKQKTFSDIFFFFFFLHCLYLDSNLNIFKKKVILAGDVFLNLGTSKYVVR